MQIRIRNIVTSGMMTALAGALAIGSALAADRGHCCPQCNSPDSCCYEEVTTHVCKMVEVKTPIKKTVYECKEVPYCLHKISKHGDCGCCSECESCPRYKKVLIKKEITCGEKCETKCVVEEVKQLVAVPCNRCGHCGNGNCEQGTVVPREITPAPTTPTPAPMAPMPPKPIVDPSASKTKSSRVTQASAIAPVVKAKPSVR